MHIGLHAGDVTHEGGNVYGGAVNIASRVCALSEPGEILVSQTVREMARTSAGVTFDDRGEQMLKGIEDPVRLFAVRGGLRADGRAAGTLLQNGETVSASPIGRWVAGCCSCTARRAPVGHVAGELRIHDLKVMGTTASRVPSRSCATTSRGCGFAHPRRSEGTATERRRPRLTGGSPRARRRPGGPLSPTTTWVPVAIRVCCAACPTSYSSSQSCGSGIARHSDYLLRTLSPLAPSRSIDREGIGARIQMHGRSPAGVGGRRRPRGRWSRWYREATTAELTVARIEGVRLTSTVSAYCGVFGRLTLALVTKWGAFNDPEASRRIAAWHPERPRLATLGGRQSPPSYGNRS